MTQVVFLQKSNAKNLQGPGRNLKFTIAFRKLSYVSDN